MKKHILVVDDEIGALTLIGIMLERGGFGVLKAKDARSALGVLDQNTPDMIILDVMMPGMDGIELCRVVRERADTASTPVLILSARGDAESIMRGIEAGARLSSPRRPSGCGRCAGRSSHRRRRAAAGSKRPRPHGSRRTCPTGR